MICLAPRKNILTGSWKDFSDVFSPVVIFWTFQYLHAHFATGDLELQQFDVKADFLYGYLDKESIYRYQVHLSRYSRILETSAKMLSNLTDYVRRLHSMVWNTF